MNYLIGVSPFVFLFIVVCWCFIKEQSRRIDAELKWQAYEHEYNKSLKSVYFVKHIQRHFVREHPDWKVECKICGRTIDDIFDVTKAEEVKSADSSHD